MKSCLSSRSSLGLVVLAACSVAPPLSPPPLDLPEGSPDADAIDLREWWQRFSDPRLVALVAKTLEHNADLAAAAARIDEAKAIARNAGDLLPVINAVGGVSRQRSSESTANPVFPGYPLEYTSIKVGLEMTYELDLWGRVRNANAATLAELAADRAAMHGLRSSLAAQVARSYFTLLATDKKLALLRRTLANRAEAAAMQNRRLVGGTGSQFEVVQADSEREAVATGIPALKEQCSRLERALAVLTGGSPREIGSARLDRGQDLPQAPAVPAGLPSDLLLRRPDIREAEAHLVAADYRVAEVRTRYYPTIRLTGYYGRESDELAELLTSPAAVWNIAGSLVQPLLGLQKINAQVEAFEARKRRFEAGYVKTVQTAFAEAFDALGSLSAVRATSAVQDARLGALREATRLAGLRYDAGLSAYLELLDAQRNLLAGESERIDTEVGALVATIDVYRALGGGWTEEEGAR